MPRSCPARVAHVEDHHVLRGFIGEELAHIEDSDMKVFCGSDVAGEERGVVDAIADVTVFAGGSAPMVDLGKESVVVESELVHARGKVERTVVRKRNASPTRKAVIIFQWV